MKTLLMYALILLIVITADASAQDDLTQQQIIPQHIHEIIAYP